MTSESHDKDALALAEAVVARGHTGTEAHRLAVALLEAEGALAAADEALAGRLGLGEGAAGRARRLLAACEQYGRAEDALPDTCDGDGYMMGRGVEALAHELAVARDELCEAHARCAYLRAMGERAEAQERVDFAREGIGDEEEAKHWLDLVVPVADGARRVLEDLGASIDAVPLPERIRSTELALTHAIWEHERAERLAKQAPLSFFWVEQAQTTAGRVVFREQALAALRGVVSDGL